MAEDEEDIFIIDSSPEPNTAVRNSSLERNTAVRNSSLERNTAARNSAPEVNHNVGEVAENIDENEINIQTSPIIATSRSQRRVTRTRSRNIQNQINAQPMLIDETPDQNEDLEEELLRINQVSEEADQQLRQLNNHIQNVNSQISGTRITAASSQFSAPINPTYVETSTNNIIGQDSASSDNLPNEQNHPLPVNEVASSSLTAIQPSVVPSDNQETSAISSVISSSVIEHPGPSVEQAPGSSIDQPPQSTEGGGSEISPYFAPNPALSEASARGNLNSSAADFQGVQLESPEEKKEKKKTKGKKRKAIESIEDDNDEGSCCTICFEAWSNSGEHRISSLRCGHFFGYTCIEKWLRGSGQSCPNCNEKSTKKDIRVHYVSKLKALDTSEKDRALADLDKEKTNNRELQLRITESQIRNKLLQEENEKLQRELHQYRKFRGDLPPALQSSQPVAMPTQPTRLVYQRRFEIVRGNEKTCRVLAYSEYNGMLLISQPSFTALAPGYGVRQFNVLDMKVGNFVSLCREQIRDLSFSRVSPHLLLSCGHDRSVRITNVSNGNKIVEFALETQVWACDWAANNDYQIFLGTNKGTVLVHDTRNPTSPPIQLTFPNGERKPIIGLRSVPAKPEAGFPQPGFLVLNLTNLWFWYPVDDENWECAKLNIGQRLVWSLDFDSDSFLVLVGCKPSPLATHLVLELNSTMIESGRTYTVRTIMNGKGGSYNQRSFLRSSLLPAPNGQVYLAFSKGTGQNDHKVIIQEVGQDRVIQELKVDRPVIDIKQMKLNDERYLALLGETELTVYKWNPVEA